MDRRVPVRPVPGVYRSYVRICRYEEGDKMAGALCRGGHALPVNTECCLARQVRYAAREDDIHGRGARLRTAIVSHDFAI